VEYAAKLMGVEPPPLVKFEDANLSEMARSFYSNSRKVSNQKIKEMLGVELKYPTYREGLEGIFTLYQ
jgi:nucleoside-diphosphate-sugar epimerase